MQARLLSGVKLHQRFTLFFRVNVVICKVYKWFTSYDINYSPGLGKVLKWIVSDFVLLNMICSFVTLFLCYPDIKLQVRDW